MKPVDFFKRSLPNKVFATFDGELFKEKGDAVLHAASLEDKEVKTHSRGDFAAKAEAQPEAEEGEGKPVKGLKPAKGKEAAKAE